MYTVTSMPGGPEFFTFKQQICIPDDAEVVFVSDIFASDYAGGAELTTEALIAASPFKTFRLHSKDVTMELLRQGVEKFWVFGNFSNLDAQLIPSIVANLRYSILEYDYKYCRYRSPEKHEANEGVQCNCQNEQHGMVVSAFMRGAKSLWWMSEAQKAHYEDMFPFLRDSPSTVLSSVFDDETFATIHMLQEKHANDERKGWIVLGSPSWVKGADAAEQWCKDNGKDYEVIWGLDYLTTLRKLAQAEGFVYLPQGRDTCPRMVIEARLLGCKLQLNENVQHASEEWFTADDVVTIESYLYAARSRFWNGVHADMGERDATLSGYTTTYNCVDADYPFKESILSMLGFCDEVVVVDAGSSDGTWDELLAMAAIDDKLKVHQYPRDRSKRRWAIDFDGRLKALARSLCTGTHCWQQDCDEVVHEEDYDKIAQMKTHFPRQGDLLCLPVIEYWGDKGKVRADVHNWKWRMSRNKPGMTHGVPGELRRFDEEGELYAAQGTDSCDYIWLGDYSRVQHLNFYNSEVDGLRRRAVEELDEDALKEYEGWYNEVVAHLPSVHHYSWWNIERKAKTYRDHWSQFWSSMYNMSVDDTAENNMWFDKPWSEVTDDDIEDIAIRLEQEKGGWVFHRKVDWNVEVPHITCNRAHPTVMDEWLERNSFEVEEEDDDEA